MEKSGKKSVKKIVLETLMHMGVCVVFGPMVMVFWIITYRYFIDSSAK